VPESFQIYPNTPRFWEDPNLRASAKNFQGWGATKKDRKITEKYRKIALLSLFRGGGNGKKTEK